MGYVSEREIIGWNAAEEIGSAPRLLMCRGVMRRWDIDSVFLFPASVNLASQNQLIEYAQSMRSR